MPVCQEAYEKILHKVFLSHNHLVHLHSQNIHKRTLPLDPVIQFFDVYTVHNILICFVVLSIFA